VNLDTTAAFWDQHVASEKEPREQLWHHPLTQAHLNRLRGDKSLLEWAIENCFSTGPMRLGLGIGAGTGSFELAMLKYGMVEEYDLFDVSAIALEKARENARAQGLENRVRTFCMDVASATLQEDTYDFLSCISSLHHMTDLTGTIHKLYKTLKPGGPLIAFEYVGPNRFAFPDIDTTIARRLYRVLDPELRGPWPELPLPNPRDVMEADPTESAHSAEIIEAVREIFDHTQVTPLGGAVAYPIWHGLKYEAIYETTKGYDLTHTIWDLDYALFSAGHLPTYFAYLVAHKLPSGHNRQAEFDLVGSS
jgi:SAM-dependent methyltransferase